MVKSILSSQTEDVLGKALAASSLRHKIISNNIANVNTPEFKRSDVLFEDRLAEALNPSKALPARTNERHLAGRNSGSFSPSIITETNTSIRVDGSNVDIDVEMANLAKNNIYYDAVAKQLGRYFSNIKAAINEGRR
ncbi:MAG: flgB [Firmicutes bacterium]|nr:flgB [Bacillota bacterium]